MNGSRWIALCACILLSAGVQSTQAETKKDANYTVCISDSCQATANSLMESMDKSMHPCEDFYAYVCNNWRNATVDTDMHIPEQDHYTFLQEDFDKAVKDVMENEFLDKFPDIKLARKYHKSCMDAKNDKNEELKKLLAILNEAGGWPIINETWKNSSDAVLNAETYYLKEWSTSTFFDLDYDATTYKNGSRLLHLVPAKPILPPGIDTNYRKLADKYAWKAKYVKFILWNIEYLVGTEAYKKYNKTALTEDAKEMADLEEILVTAAKGDWFRKGCYRRALPIHEIFAEIYEMMPELAKRPEAIAWLYNLNKTSSNEPILDFCYSYKVFIQLKLFKNSSNRAVVNYINWRIVARVLELLRDDDTDLYYPGKQTGFRKCVSANPALPAVLNYLADTYLEERYDKQIRDIYEDVDGLASWNFLSQKTMIKDYSIRMYANEFHVDVKPFFSIPMDNYKKEYVEAQFPDGLSNSFVDNIFLTMKHRPDVTLLARREPSRSRLWDADPVNVHVQADIYRKYRLIPIGIQKFPFHKKNRPPVFNYAGIGTVMAQSIMNDYYKYLVSASRGYQSIRDAIKVTAKDFTNQWNQYRFTPTWTFSDSELENVFDYIAERDAVEVTYKGFKRNQKLRKWEDIRLPGLEELTQDQLFFINYAYTRCTTLEKPRPLSVEKRTFQQLEQSARKKVILSTKYNSDFKNSFKCL